MFNKSAVASRPTSLLATHTVLRNTYFLLSLTLMVSALTAGIAMHVNAAPPGIILTLAGMFGLSFLTQALSRSAWGVAAIFAFTAFMGYVLGPLLNFYIHSFSNGSQLVITALGGTGVIFFCLSAFVLMTKRDFGFMGGMLFALGITAFVCSLAGLFFHLPMLQLVVSGLFALFASGMILFQTSLIVNGGERNYIIATINLYMALFNLFLSLLQILSFFSGNRD